MQRMWGVKKVFSFMFLALAVFVLLTACGGGSGGNGGSNPPSSSGGGKFPIATLPTTNVGGREMSRSAAFDGTNYLVGIQGDSYANQGVSAQLVSQSGTLVGQRISLGTTCLPQPQQNCGGAPAVAFDGTNYLMVWEQDAANSTLIYGQRINTAGGKVGSIFTVGSGTDIDDLNLLFDGNNYFAVWKDTGTAPDQTRNVYGQFVTTSGQQLGSRIDIATAANGQRNPVAAFDGTNILVAWVDGRNLINCPPDCIETDIYGQLISKSTANAAGSLSGGNFLINAGTLPRDNPIGIAFDGTNYLVTFTEETTFPGTCPLSGCKWDVYGQLVTTGGAPTGSKITISNTAPTHFFAHPVFNGANYLVAWTEGEPSTLSITGIKGRYFNTSGAPLGSEFVINNDAGVIFSVVTGFNSGKYFVVVNTGDALFNSTDGDVYGLFITP